MSRLHAAMQRCKVVVARSRLELGPCDALHFHDRMEQHFLEDHGMPLDRSLVANVDYSYSAGSDTCHCGNPMGWDRKLCSECRSKEATRRQAEMREKRRIARETRSRVVDELRKSRREQGLCSRCGEAKAPDSTLCVKHRDYMRKSNGVIHD